MGGSYQSGKASVVGTITTNSTPGIPSSSQTIVQVSTSTGGAQDLYTVPAGKTFYLYGIWVYSNIATRALQIFQNDGTTKVGYCAGAATDSTNSVDGGGCPMAVYTTGQIVKANLGGNASGGIWGVLV